MAESRRVDNLPRLPLEGNLDLTYRCNNRCRHCWLWEPDTPEVAARELTFDEIRGLVEEARSMGCRRWNISGGEPMLRADFSDIFDYITSRSASYSTNTNGALITPEIAKLMTRKGTKMVALYGASAAVHDHITRTPGSFEQTMQGFAYLEEAGAGFIVQLVPMRDNWHEWERMQELAQSLSKHWRVGAPWLFLSACGPAARDAEIAAQRLEPAAVIVVEPPGVVDDPPASDVSADAAPGCVAAAGDDRLYASCIARRDDFHVDPYGGVTFCSFVKDPKLRFDLRAGTFREAWDEFIPALAEEVRGGDEYMGGCAACELRDDCRWCAVYGYLEHGRHAAKVDYLCEVAREARASRQERLHRHRRYFEIAGITVRVDSDLPIEDGTFDGKFASFAVDGPGSDLVTIAHHFGLPDIDPADLGDEVYRKVPWAIYRKGDSWVYLGIGPDEGDPLHRAAVFSDDHTRAQIYNTADGERAWRRGGLASLTLLPTDQIMLARVLADRKGCYLHSGGVVVDGHGLLFVGHSEAGKSTTMKLFDGRGEVLCDDRNIVRRLDDGFHVFGTWSHGEVPIVSSAAAPLHAVLFIRKASQNRIELLEDRAAIRAGLLACLIKPLVTADWWDKMLVVVERLAVEVPCYEMHFDRSGAIVPLVEELARS